MATPRPEAAEESLGSKDYASFEEPRCPRKHRPKANPRRPCDWRPFDSHADRLLNAFATQVPGSHHRGGRLPAVGDQQLGLDRRRHLARLR